MSLKLQFNESIMLNKTIFSTGEVLGIIQIYVCLADNSNELLLFSTTAAL